ncbi:MAG: hypothetical protein F4227_00005 [Gammaproteobacteria bacterium]|nr:hypothetical protein [Gammaproteobacteria bacterium]MYF01401.1 hypothetical protein [Gammaproteobacteria bacterium]MYI76728.1 hypothetical protein [Gammaproteobacteria bacterium]
MRLKNKTSSRSTLYYWSGGVGLGLIAVAVVCVLLYENGRTLSKSHSVAVREPTVSDTSAVVSTSRPTTVATVAVVEELPRVNFPPGSVEEACELNDFIPYHYDDPDDQFDWLSALESSACWTALDDHISTINPYLWGELNTNHPLAFLALEKPLTFGRIFTDPAGDLARVQEALSRPECLLEQGAETNWELKEICHADAFLNYALFNRFCFDEGVSNRTRTYYWEEENPTPEQDRFMWKQTLEDAWVRSKCEEFAPELQLTVKQYPEFTELLFSLGDPERVAMKKAKREMYDPETLITPYLIPTLIEHAARLGDDAAGLTRPMTLVWNFASAGQSYHEEGYKYGRFSDLLTSVEWKDFVKKSEPNTDHFLRSFHFLTRLSALRPNPRDELQLNWEWVARHMCALPHDKLDLESESEESATPQSCQEIVHELRQLDIKFRPVLDALDKFEQVALELGVYE